MVTDASFGRTVADTLFANTLGVTLETRKIILAQGIQFTNADYAGTPYMVMPDGLTTATASRDSSWPRSMRKRAPLAIVPTAGGFQFTSFTQGVTYDVTIVNTKDKLVSALLTPNIHVIYAGHARFGRGPCFGILPTPGEVSATEDWENGTNPTTTGIFRMGYPFIGVPVSEVLEHGYTADLTSSTIPVPASQSEPDLRPFVGGSLKAKTAADIDPGLPAQAKDKDPTKTWWAYQAFEGGKKVWHVVLNAGWTGTVSAPADLGATTPACHVFCHFACDTFKHNHTIVRKPEFKGWAKSGDDRLAYFTLGLSYPGMIVNYWLYHLFTYPKPNGFGLWEPSINYAVAHTNSDLSADGETFSVI